MKFMQAYVEMLKGKKVTRPGFPGYWYISPKTSLISIKLYNEIDEFENDEIGFIVNHVLAEDWEVLKNTTHSVGNS